LSTDQAGRGRGLPLMIAALTWIAPFSIDTYLPSFPEIGEELGASHAQLQQSLSLYLVAFAVTTLFYGPLSDAFGRRRVLLAGLGIYVVSSLAAAAANSIEALYLARIGQGLSASAGLVLGRAILRDMYTGPAAQKAMSSVMMLFALAPAVAPIIGGWLHEWAGWRSVFLFLAGLGVLLWIMVYVAMEETLPVRHRVEARIRPALALYARALRHRRFMALVLMIALNFAGSFLYIAAAPVLLYDHLGLSAGQFGYLFLPLVGGVILGAFVSGRLADRATPAVTAGLGMAVMAGAAGVNLVQSLTVAPSIPWVVTPVACYAFGVSIAMPALSLLALECFPHNRGLASAAQSFVQTFGNAMVAGVLVPIVAVAVPGMAMSMVLLLTASAVTGAVLLGRR